MLTNFRAISRPITSLLCALCIFSIGLLLQPVTAQDSKLSEAEVERIKLEVMRELRESDFLQREIELGIQAFIRKQREQQAEAEANQQRQ